MFFSQRRRKSKDANPYIKLVGRANPIHEMYQALPRLQQIRASEALSQDDVAYLEAIDSFSQRVNHTLLRGLQSMCEMMSDASCSEGFYFANQHLTGFMGLLSLNLDLLEENFEVERSVAKIRQQHKPVIHD